MLRGFLAVFLMIVGSSLVGATASQAATFQFSQAGYDDGAILSGSFTGMDINNDGRLTRGTSLNPDELTEFTLNFSGNSLVPGFGAGLSDLLGFIYGLDGGPLGDTQPLGNEGMFGLVSSFFFATGSGGFPGCGQGGVCGQIFNGSVITQTTQLVQITSDVPEPAGIGFVILGFGALAMRQRAVSSIGR